MATRRNRGSRTPGGNRGSKTPDAYDRGSVMPEGLTRSAVTPSGISDMLIASDRGPRGPDDYTPIETLPDFTRKLGQIHQATVVLLTKQEVTEGRLGKIESRVEKGYVCQQVDTLTRHEESSKDLSEKVGQLALVDASTQARVDALDEFVRKTRDERSKYMFWMIGVIVGLVLTAAGVGRLLMRDPVPAMPQLSSEVTRRLGGLQKEAEERHSKILKLVQELEKGAQSVSPVPKGEVNYPLRQLELWCLTLTRSEKLRLRSRTKEGDVPPGCRRVE